MGEKSETPQETWARPVAKMSVTQLPVGATNLNVEGRRPVSPLQGFGPLWLKTYRIRLRGAKSTPEEVMALWKEKFPQFQPKGNKFYPPQDGVRSGEIIFIESAVSAWPGRLPGIPISSGVRVIYNDDVCFTIMTPQGFPESGWNSFSTFEEDGETWAQVQSMARTADPIYEFGFRFMGGARFQEETWQHVLKAVAAYFDVRDEPVDVRRDCIDPRLQWREVRNLWQNAMIGSMLYMPVRMVRGILGVAPNLRE